MNVASAVFCKDLLADITAQWARENLGDETKSVEAMCLKAAKEGKYVAYYIAQNGLAHPSVVLFLRGRGFKVTGPHTKGLMCISWEPEQ
jgi:hypothetical protein